VNFPVKDVTIMRKPLCFISAQLSFVSALSVLRNGLVFGNLDKSHMCFGDLAKRQTVLQVLQIKAEQTRSYLALGQELVIWKTSRPPARPRHAIYDYQGKHSHATCIDSFVFSTIYQPALITFVVVWAAAGGSRRRISRGETCLPPMGSGAT
jgi:hypothetical protein